MRSHATDRAGATKNNVRMGFNDSGLSRHDDRRSRAYAIVQVDDILVQQADTSRGYCFPDRMHLACAVETIERVTVTLVNIQCPGSQRVGDAGWLPIPPLFQCWLARDLDAAKRFFRKMLKDEPLLSPEKIGTDGANTFPSAIRTSIDNGLLHPDPVHYVTKHLQQGIERDHFRVKKNMPKIGGFQSFKTARRTIAGFEAMLWLRKGFGFSGGWTVNNQNDLLAHLFGLQKVDKA